MLLGGSIYFNRVGYACKIRRNQTKERNEKKLVLNIIFCEELNNLWTFKV